MLKDDKNPKKMIESVHHYITDLDSFRLPISFITPRFFVFFKFFSNFSKLGQKSDLFQKTPDLHKKLQKELDPYFKEVLKITIIDLALYFGGYFLIKILLIIIQMTLESVFLFENIILDLIMIIIEFFWLISLLLWIFITHMRVAGEKYDDELKRAVQELINYGIELIKENNLNPKDYPIKLRHNDYEGLEYEFKGENDYLGWFKP